jgi:aspartate/methionine/tyrosine aminotransferase
MKIAARSEIAPFYVMEVMKAAAERAATTGDVLHLEVGQPSTPAPRGVIEAARRILDEDRLGYTDATGIPPLRHRIALHYRERHDLDIDPDRIAVTVGASGGCVLAFLATFDAGDRVAVTEPGYPCYRNMLEALGIEVVGVPVGPETRFVPTNDQLDAAGPLDGLVLASPSNPTGTTLTSAELESLAAHCTAGGIRIVADEIYHGISYGDPAPTALAFSDSAVVVQSFSKYYSMTGWRLGWLVVPDELIRPVERLAQNLFISAPALSQHAGLSAFDCGEELDRNVARYATNRAVLLEAFEQAGLARLAPPDGAFYLYVDVSRITDDSPALCRTWLDELGVATTPGIDFDPVRGRRFVRFSYSESTEDVTEAARRIEGWMRERRGR